MSPVEPFFLTAAAGRRLCLYHAPHGPCRAALLYAPPFAEELNKTRRMAALQARALAAQGVAVLQIDLYGCGDSDGDFADARWAGWLDDLHLGAAWLQARHPGAIGLWGTRLGALLALDYARQARHRPGPILLWQPVSSGAAYLNQFLRLRQAGAMLSGAERSDNAALRAQLQRAPLEVAGYALHGALAEAIEALDGAALAPPAAVPVHWFDLGAPGRTLAPGAAMVAAQWRAGGATVHTHLVDGPAFWATQETTECPALLAATVAAMQGAAYAA